MHGFQDNVTGVRAEAAGTLRNVRVLVVDDEEAIRRVVRSLLREVDCLVDVAGNGREALRILLEKDFDVAVVDLQMPDMGGTEFLREARSIWPWLGMVILSGRIEEDALVEARRFGVTRALGKPVEVRQLREAVMEEARLKRKLLELSASQGLNHIQGQLALLRKASEAAIAADNIDAAMRAFSEGISHLLPCSMVGMLHVESDEQSLYLNGVRAVSPGFALAVQETMLGRYESLSGKLRPGGTLKIHAEAESNAGGVTKLVHSFTVPILGGDGVRGLLTLAQSELDDSTGRDASFLYHAGNHLSTVLYALNTMRRISVHDALTGAYNRKGLEEEYERAWQQSRRYSFPLGVAIIDLDHFKEINDTHGHAAGDQVLKEFSDLTHKVARGTDIVARYGGDEMVVILPQSGPAEVIAFGERLLEAVHRHIFCERAQNLVLTVSVGVASSVVGHGSETAQGLMGRADLALYRAKKAGRDRVVIEQPDYSVSQPASAQTAPDIDTMAAQQNFAPAIQPTKPQPAVLDPSQRVNAPREMLSTKGRILVVDDDPGIATLFSRILKKQGYEAAVENSGSAAIERLKAEGDKFDVLITDLSMPDKSGLELLDEMRSINENLMKIVVTGNATLDNAVLSLRRGAYDFIEKPVVSGQLIAVVERAMEYGKLRAENKRYQLHLEDMVKEKSAALREALDRIKVSYDFTLEAMVNLLDAREKSTSRHSLRVRELAVILATEMNLSESEIEEISKGALLHDIGKMAIPDSVLLKPGKLTDEEKVVMAGHVVTGHKILCLSSYLEKAADIVHSHHESWDGAGYPRGLKGTEIPLGARIFSVVDTYDAMRSNRVYRRALEPAAVIAEIQRCSGTQFDPDVVAAFLRCQPRFEIAGKWDEENARPL